MRPDLFGGMRSVQLSTSWNSSRRLDPLPHVINIVSAASLVKSTRIAFPTQSPGKMRVIRKFARGSCRFALLLRQNTLGSSCGRSTLDLLFACSCSKSSLQKTRDKSNSKAECGGRLTLDESRPRWIVGPAAKVVFVRVAGTPRAVLQALNARGLWDCAAPPCQPTPSHPSQPTKRVTVFMKTRSCGLVFGVVPRWQRPPLQKRVHLFVVC